MIFITKTIIAERVKYHKIGEKVLKKAFWGEVSLRYRLATCSKGTPSPEKLPMETCCHDHSGTGDNAKEPGVRSLRLSSLHLATDTTISLSHNLHQHQK